MKQKYDEIDDLIADLENDIESALMDEVLDTVKDIEVRHVEDDVFKVYKPTIYERRTSSGIGDRDNIVGTLEGKMQLKVDNITEFNSGYGTYNRGQGLAELINDGNGEYYYDYPFEYVNGRPFMDNTADEVESTRAVDDALEKGLKRRGYY